jgi:hypothetical protein
MLAMFCSLRFHAPSRCRVASTLLVRRGGSIASGSAAVLNTTLTLLRAPDHDFEVSLHPRSCPSARCAEESALPRRKLPLPVFNHMFLVGL